MNDYPDGGYGWPVDPADCDSCLESISGCCKYHRQIEREVEERDRKFRELCERDAENAKRLARTLMSPFASLFNDREEERGPVN